MSRKACDPEGGTDMELILVTGPQAVGKMTIGRELEKHMDAQLLYNHQTIDLFARFLGYTKEAFRLSDETRKNLFRAFVKSDRNVVSGIIFTVVVAYNLESDRAFLKEVCDLFLQAGGSVFYVELEASLDIRLERNVGEDRLLAKPSKRDLGFSKNELLDTHRKHRLNSKTGEVERLLPDIHYLRIDSTLLTAAETAAAIKRWINDTSKQQA